MTTLVNVLRAPKDGGIEFLEYDLEWVEACKKFNAYREFELDGARYALIQYSEHDSVLHEGQRKPWFVAHDPDHIFLKKCEEPPPQEEPPCFCRA